MEGIGSVRYRGSLGGREEEEGTWALDVFGGWGGHLFVNVGRLNKFVRSMISGGSNRV